MTLERALVGCHRLPWREAREGKGREVMGVTHLEEAGEDVGGLAADDEEARVELAEAGVQILQTLQQEPAA